MRANRLQGIPWILAIIAVALLVGFAASSSDAQLLMPNGESDNPPALPDQEQPEVLNRGPVHEAFAEPVNLEYQSGLIASERPPRTSRNSRRMKGPKASNMPGSPGTGRGTQIGAATSG